MGRTVVRQLDSPRSRRSRDRVTIAALAVVVIFALVGLGSTGAFVAGKLSNNSNTKGHGPTAGNSIALADIARAQAQATALVKAAQDAGGSIVHTATARANRQAAAIVAAAHRHARAIVAAVPTPAPTAAVAFVQPTAVVYVQPTIAAVPLATSAAGATGTGLGTTGTGQLGTPNLQGLPATWKVVGYNATFGTGPGSAGSISVLNRGNVTFSGVALVKYTRGGTASASFSGLAPGQSLTLPLDGKTYTGGGYQILLTNLR